MNELPSYCYVLVGHPRLSNTRLLLSQQYSLHGGQNAREFLENFLMVQRQFVFVAHIKGDAPYSESNIMSLSDANDAQKIMDMLMNDKRRISKILHDNGRIRKKYRHRTFSELFATAPTFLSRQETVGKPQPAMPTTQIYIQTMNSTNHSQAFYKPKELKKKTNGELDDIEKIESQISFPVKSEDMFYCVRNLHQKPHGLSFETSLDLTTISLAEANIAHKKIRNHGYTCKYFDKNLKLLYSGSSILKWFSSQQQRKPHHGLDKQWLKDFVIKHGKIDCARDVSDGGKISKRVAFGFGQIQPSSNKQQRKCTIPDTFTSVVKNEDALKMPTLNTTMLDLMLQEAPQVVEALAEILGFSQRCLESFYQNDETRPFSNEFRSKTFGKDLHSHFFRDEAAASEGPSFDWEYIDITVKNCADLPRHMDHKNDSRVGYNHCAVYSFVIDGYRVSIIMTTRNTVGSNADHLQHLFFGTKAAEKKYRDDP
eukprot:scaffold11119_cov107-Cylindrotheca_fusiformis.AAC.1